MLNSIILFSIRNKLIVAALTACLVGYGLYSLTRLPIDAVPDITNNQVQVITISANLAPLEIEKYITFPVEQSTANIAGLIETRSISRFGLSVVTLVFDDDVDVYWARAQVSESLKSAEQMIPAGSGTPSLAPVSTGLSEIFQYTIGQKGNSDSIYSLMDLRTVQDWIIRRELLRVKGVADVSSFGGYVKQYEVSVDPVHLRSAGVTLEELFVALEKGNSNTGAAYIEKNDQSYFIRGIGMAKDLEDIGEMVVKSVDGIPLLVRDVATVQHGSGVRYGALSKDGKGETAGGVLLMLKGENSSRVIDRVKEKISEIEKTLPPGLTIVPFLDREVLVSKAVRTVTTNLIEGGLIVIFVLVLLLGNLRAGLIVASVIPLSMLFAISMMVLFGISGNLMSLGAIDFGLIVDGAVIIVEFVVASLYAKRSTINFDSRADTDKAIYQSVSRIRMSAVFGEMIILIVYIPILSLTGIEGKMFKPMALTVMFALAGAFLLSLTYIPMMCAAFMSRAPKQHETFAERLVTALRKKYMPALWWTMKHKAAVVLAGLVLFVLSVFLFNKLGGEFIPELNEGDYAIETRMLPGTSLTQTIAVAKQVEKMLLDSFPDEVFSCVSKIGTAEIPTDPMPIESMDLIVVLKDRSQWKKASTKEQLDNKLEQLLAMFPGVSFSVQQPIQMRFNELMTSAKTDIVVKLYGDDLHTLTEKAEEISRIISDMENTEQVQVQKIEGLPQVQVEYDRTRMASYGITVAQVNTAVQTAFAGKKAGVIFEEEKGFDLVVRFAERFRKNESDLEQLLITAANGAQVPLGEIADVRMQSGPAEIARDNTRRRINIGFNVSGRDVQGIVEELKARVDEAITLPSGYSIHYGGQFENLEHAKKRLAIVLPVALLFIFFLLYLSFRSVAQSLLVLSAIPLATIGGVVSLYLRDMPFSISAGVGFIALFGVAVLNGIVLISYLNQLETEGMNDLHERVTEGVQQRFRPVIITALVASLGFLPMALSDGAGAEVQKPLATVVIGGLISCTLLTLFVLPAAYALLNQKRKRSHGTIAKIIAILFLSGPLIAHAQQQSVPVAPAFPSLETALASAVKNHPAMLAAEYNIAQQKALTSGSFNPPPLDVLWQVPQGYTYRPSILQAFDFPLVYTARHAYFKQQEKLAVTEKSITRATLVRRVKDAYLQVVYAASVLRVLQTRDSILSIFAGAARSRYEAGDIATLDRLNAEATLAEVKSKLFIAQEQLTNSQYEFSLLTGMRDTFSVEGLQLTKSLLQLPGVDSAQVAHHPDIVRQYEQIKLREKSLTASKWRLAPGFTIGYFNQIETSAPFRYNLQFGIRVPLFFWTFTSIIKYDKLSLSRAEAELELMKMDAGLQLREAVAAYRNQLNSVTFYEKTGLVQAGEILRTARSSFAAGNISYHLYLFSIEKSFEIQMGYLNALKELNLTIHQIQYLKGETQ